MKSFALAAAAAFALLPQMSSAATYRYVGETYEVINYYGEGCSEAYWYTCRGSHTSDHHLMIELWVDGGLNPNVANLDLVIEGVAFSISAFDGINWFGSRSDYATFTTDEQGNIIDWIVADSGLSGPDFNRFHSSASGGDWARYEREFQSGQIETIEKSFAITQSVGTWTRADAPAVEAVPLPAGALLLISGLAGAAVLRRPKSGASS